MKQITLLTWPDYINPKTLEQFESEYGVKVNLDIVPSAVELIERMKSSGLAHEFLNYVLRPEIAAQEARYTRYATGNRSALMLLDDEMRNDTSTYPPDDVLKKLEAGMPLDAEGQKRRDVLWKGVRE